MEEVRDLFKVLSSANEVIPLLRLPGLESITLSHIIFHTKPQNNPENIPKYDIAKKINK